MPQQISNDKMFGWLSKEIAVAWLVTILFFSFGGGVAYQKLEAQASSAEITASENADSINEIVVDIAEIKTDVAVVRTEQANTATDVQEIKEMQRQILQELRNN